MSDVVSELRPQALYRFFDAAGDLLYVGISLNPTARWEQHRSDKPWWGDVASATIERFDTREEVRSAEVAAIRAESPRHNKTHHPSRKGSRVRTFRVSEALWRDCQDRAWQRRETIADVVRLTLHAYVADPQAFNIAVATLRTKR